MVVSQIIINGVNYQVDSGIIDLMSYDEAMRFAKEESDRWRLPTAKQLNILYSNRVKLNLEGFMEGKTFWSSEMGSTNYSRCVRICELGEFSKPILIRLRPQTDKLNILFIKTMGSYKEE